MSRTVSEAPPLTGLSYFAAAFPLLCALSLGFVPALKGSAVGLDPFIDYSDFFADAMSQLGVLGTLLLGTTSLVPFLQRRTRLFEIGFFALASLYAYLILMAASRVSLPDTWIAISSLALGLAFFPLFRAERALRANALVLVPIALRFVGAGLETFEFSELPEIPRDLAFAFAKMLDVVATALAFLGIFGAFETEKRRSSLLLALLLVAVPVGGKLALGPQTTGVAGYLERAFEEVAAQSFVTPGFAGALLLPTFLAGFTGIVTGRVRVIAAASATLISALAPTPLTIAAFATLTLRIYVEGDGKPASKEARAPQSG